MVHYGQWVILRLSEARGQHARARVEPPSAVTGAAILRYGPPRSAMLKSRYSHPRCMHSVVVELRGLTCSRLGAALVQPSSEKRKSRESVDLFFPGSDVKSRTLCRSTLHTLRGNGAKSIFAKKNPEH